MASVHCVDDQCRELIDDSYNFCPHCGQDNRAPENRKPVSPCMGHDFAGGSFCVRCGDGSAVAGYSRRKSDAIAPLAFICGLLIIAAAVIILILHTMPNSAGGRWVESWFETTMYSRSSYSYHSYPNPIGWDIVFGLGFIGVALAVSGLGHRFYSYKRSRNNFMYRDNYWAGEDSSWWHSSYSGRSWLWWFWW